MKDDGRNRVVIEGVYPEIDCGQHMIKRVQGEEVVVSADIFADGHDKIKAVLLYRKSEQKVWQEVPLQSLINDRWQGRFVVTELGTYDYTLKAWIDRFGTWLHDLQKKTSAGLNVGVDLLIGAELIEQTAKRAAGIDKKKLNELSNALKKTDNALKILPLLLEEENQRLIAKYPNRTLATVYPKELRVTVDPRRALFSSWYEFFPRSASFDGSRHATLKDCEKLLPEIAEMGFDIVYLPPIHPIGKTNRKGKNNSNTAKSGEPGSPWAIGGEEGGHKAIHPQLGSEKDFVQLVKKAKNLGLEVALDLAFQCSLDHPYLKEHPEWFHWRPDGSVQYAENPPKKYEDVVPINFETETWEELWDELLSVMIHWIEKGVHVFRVDNPHTKPFSFWEWSIGQIKEKYPDIIFLSEAFTRPKVMHRLAKVGFTQSYTYFTWRNTKTEFQDYMNELTKSSVKEFFRPNFWPNTPDILPEHLQYGGKPAFMARFVLAATLSSNFGIYGPAYELLVNKAILGKEEYLDSEKYEIKNWDRNKPGNIKDLIRKVNRIRKENEALQNTWNIEFYQTDNQYLLCYGKTTADNIIIVVVNLDYFHLQTGKITLPIKELGIPEKQSYLVEELLSDQKIIWQGANNYVELDPRTQPAFIFRIQRQLRREQDFDYFM